MRPEQLIGRQVRAIRESRGMTQEELGIALGQWLKQSWPRQGVSGAERGERSFTGAELVAIAHVLQTHVGALLVPPMDAGDIEMPSGATLAPSDVARVAVDPETRNVLPAAMEAIGRIGNWLADHKVGLDHELEVLRINYEVLAAGGGHLPGGPATETGEKFTRQVQDLAGDEEGVESDG